MHPAAVPSNVFISMFTVSSPSLLWSKWPFLTDSQLQMTIFFVNPAITAVLAWIFRGEILSFLSIAAILASFGGVAVISKPPFLSGGHALWDTSHLIGAILQLRDAAHCQYLFFSMLH